jgi:16S rRNA (uracil1498-N3)-methyltransferase
VPLGGAAAVIRLVAEAAQIRGDTVLLRADQVHYLERVMRRPRGSRVVVLTPDGPRWGRWTERTALVLEEAAPRVRPPRLSVGIAQALLKGDRFRDVVDRGTQVGVAAFQPLVTARSVVRSASSDRIDRWRRVAREAAEQCGRGDVPVVADPIALSVWDPATPILALEPGGPPLFRQYMALGAPDRLWLLVGPEGGLAPAELEPFRAAGRVAGCGAYVLRAENAGAMAALLLLQWVEWAAADGPPA